MERIYKFSKLIAFVTIAIVALSGCEKEVTGEIAGYEYVDLGLPSGLMWATCNIGASSPEDYGNYYAWSECSAAVGNLGSKWRMPSRVEWQELIDECDWTYVSYSRDHRVSGYKVTGSNGNSIFLPAMETVVPLLDDYELAEYGYYWSSTPCSDDDDAYYFYFYSQHYYGHSSGYSVRYGYRGSVRSVRPVIDFCVPTITTNAITEITPTTAVGGGNVINEGRYPVTSRGVCWSTTQNPTIENDHTTDGSGLGNFTSSITGLTYKTTYYVRAYATNRAGTSYGEQMSFTTGRYQIGGYDYVDLGLPSGLKWATCNIGASSPEDYGNYYAWGETEPKSTYTWDNSITYGVEMEDISGNPQYDAATANWGSTWRMPTQEECEELVEECTLERTKQNGVYGMKVTGPNGYYIFLPAAGWRYGSSLNSAGEDGSYWSSTPSSRGDYAYYFNFNSGNYYVDDYWLCAGRSVRPVSE